MSADNWAICPKCSPKAVHDCSCGCSPPEAKYTLREDYEIGVSDGKFFVSYSAICRNHDKPNNEGCGFEYEFNFEKEI